MISQGKDKRLWFWGNKLRFPSTEQSGIKGAEELMRVVSNATATDLNSHQHKLALFLGKCPYGKNLKVKAEVNVKF